MLSFYISKFNSKKTNIPMKKNGGNIGVLYTVLSTSASKSKIYLPLKMKSEKHGHTYL